MRSHRLCTLAAAIAVGSFVHGPPASADLIDFETVQGVSPMGYTAGSPVPASADLATQLQLSDGVSFTSAVGYVALVLLGSGHATSGVDGIGGVGASGVLDYSSFDVAFSLPGDPSKPAVTGSVSIRGDQIAIPGTATLEAFDLSGRLLGSVTADDVPGGLTLSFSAAGIHSIHISETSNTIAFDDLSFGTPTRSVPEPSSLILALVGAAGAAGYGGRRGRTGRLR